MNALPLTGLLDIADPGAFDPRPAWLLPRPARDRLRVPIGVGPDGHGFALDLKHAAQGGMGPHGLIVGATGSGKSELLRTIVLALAATHDPRVVNFAFLDFLGGATFAAFDGLPHTSAVITNLAEDLSLVDRLIDALGGELLRRQELLAGRSAPGSTPPPVLLLVVDEFSELVTYSPDVLDLFVRIGRSGGPLGVQLLLATQRYEEGRLRGLEANLSYRIGMRTFSTVESRALLGVPDAYELPSAPGHGLLKVGAGRPARFTAAYASGPYPGPSTVDDLYPPSLCDILIGRMRGQGPRAHPVWLPPLGEPPALGDLLGPIAVAPGRGLGVQNPGPRTALHGLVGTVDAPFEQRRDPMWLDLSAGNAAVVGGPRSGKSTLLLTLVASLALRHSPDEARFYCLDFGGGQLSALSGLPHVGGVATSGDAGAARRTIVEVHGLIGSREAPGAVGRRAGPDVFLVVDGWAAVRDECDDLGPLLDELAHRGPRYGIHLIAATPRWEDLPPDLRGAFGTGIELRLPDPRGSAINRRAAAVVPDRPGRGLTPDGRHFLAALPRLDGLRRVDDLTGAVAGLAARARAAWPGPAAPAIRLLPAELPYAALPGPRGGRLPIGVAEADLRPVHLDFDAEPHALLFGDEGSGKSSFLRGLARSVARGYQPAEARIVIVDYRRSLLGCVDTGHLIGYGTTDRTTTEILEEVAAALRARLPGPDLTPAQPGDRGRWRGPALYLLVDDHDLVAAAGSPLAPLLEYLPHGRDIGLRVVVARRTAGAGRALRDPVLNAIRELGSPGILLSGDRAEGRLFGDIGPRPLPPGRARLVTRGQGVRMLQLAWTPPGT